MSQHRLSYEHKEIIGPADLYERDKVPSVFRPLAQIFLEYVPIEKGATVLDVACGTGIVARLVSERVGMEGSVVGVDIDTDMVAVARATTPPHASITWHVACVEDMFFLEDETFDWVICQQGFQYFKDRDRALGEIYRVLKTNGRLAMIMWRSVDKYNQPKQWAEAQALKKHGCDEAGGKILNLVPFYDGNENDLRWQIQTAGFREINIFSDFFIRNREVPEEVVTEDDYPDLDLETRTAVVSDIRKALERFRTENGTAVPHGYHLVICSK